jgi:hypothetical protein
MSVRLTDRLLVRVPTLKNTGEHGSSERNRKESIAMIPSRSFISSAFGGCYQLRANTSRCTQMLVSERTPHEEGGSANRLRRRARATPRESEVFCGSNVEERDGNATNLRGISQENAARRGIRRIPEATRVASAQDLDTARSDVSLQRWDEHECGGTQTWSTR